MKYCNDCLTPIKSDSKEEYCAFCKRDRAPKERTTAQDYFSYCKVFQRNLQKGINRKTQDLAIDLGII